MTSAVHGSLPGPQNFVRSTRGRVPRLPRLDAARALALCSLPNRPPVLVDCRVDISDKHELRKDLDYLCLRLATEVPADLQEDYFRGRLFDPGVYEKVGEGDLDGHPLWAYLLACEGYLRQPSLEDYYDIFRAARAVPLVRCLAMALRELDDQQVRERASRMAVAAKFDQLDSLIFEAVVGGAYQRRFRNARIEFVPESARQKSPDIAVRLRDGRSLYVECKRFDRSNSHHTRVRATVRQLVGPAIFMLRELGVRRVVEVEFKGDPAVLTPEEMQRAVLHVVTSGVGVETSALKVNSRAIGPEDSDFLYPSPKYFRQRFGCDSAEWHGLIPGVDGERSGVSFFAKAHWDAAILWRVADPHVLWKVTKLNFELMFKGLQQLQTVEGPRNLHVWIERNAAWGHRAEHLMRFYRVLDGGTVPFSHIVFNETCLDISPQGRFEFVEHGHAIGGPLREMDRPEVTVVFVGPEDTVATDGAWGEGATLPPLDDQYA